MNRPFLKKITIHAETNKLALFGSYDQHIKMIEDAFSVEITARGQEIRATGVLDQVEQAEQAITQLMRLARNEHHLTTEEVNQVIQDILSEDNGDAPSALNDAKAERIIVSQKKRAIGPKSVAQRRYIDHIREYDVVAGIGPAGTGKTYLAMAMAVSAFLKKEVERIVLVRPAVEAGESLGFLPGTLVEKVNPYLRPLYDALYDMMEADHVNRLLERGEIEIAPLAFMRGRTLNDAFIILDEAQNTTSMQMKMFLTRLGFRSKAVITGDVTQIDLPKGEISGLVEIQKVLEEVRSVQFTYFTGKDVVRHPLVKEIISAYERYQEKNRGDKTSFSSQ
ncbi:MAG: PhoH family protein [Nitrospiria bacterium]